MAAVNKVIIVGNLGNDPEVRAMSNGEPWTTVSVATTESWKDKMTGEKREQTEWHRVVFYRKLAEIAGQYLKKGSSVYIEGRLRTRKWQGKEDGIDRYTTEIMADNMQMLGGRPGASGSVAMGDPYGSESSTAMGTPQPTQSFAPSAPIASPSPRPSSPVPSFADMDDDIPF